tara:strand:+ start:2555 stop:3298 length:744 start_codon:yes stop_codon:yes gene_type:complete
MSLKSLIQLIILIIIFFIIGGVYFKYFAKEKILVTQTSQLTTTEKTQNLKQENKNNDTSEIIELSDKEKSNQNKNNNLNRDNLTNSEKDKSEVKVINKDADISNIVKDVEYLTTDKNGNKYRILARSGRTNKSNRDILDLNTVRGEISSKQRSTIFIISEFAEYNSSTLGSKFYQNVVINYEDKQITCENFDINMDTNIAIAYNNVVVTDPKSIMRAGKITLDIETKEIDINPDTDEKSKVKINTKQ